MERRMVELSVIPYVAVGKRQIVIDIHDVSVMESRVIDREIRQIMLVEIELSEEHHDRSHDESCREHRCDKIRDLELLSDREHNNRYYYRTEARPAKDTLHYRDAGQRLSAACIK